MRLTLVKQLATFTFSFALVAATAGEATAQRSGGAGSGITSRNSGVTSRGGAQSGGGGQQLPYSQAGGRSQSGLGSPGGGSGITSRGGMGGNAGGGAGGVGGQGGPGQGGPMSAGLAQGGNDRFQEGGFVGRDANDVRAGFDSLSGGRGPGGMMDQMIENLNEMRDSRRRWRERNAAPSPVRVRLVPAFDLPLAPLAGTVSPEVQMRLTKIMTQRGVGAPQVQVAAGVAVLSGQVATDRERALLAQVAALEPGVTRVENRVTVAAPLAAPQQ